MKRSMLLAVFALTFGVVAEATAQATASANTTLSFTMQQRLFLDVSDDDLTFPDPTTSDLDAGYTQTVSHNVQHKGNVNHVITVAPSDPSWTTPFTYVGSKAADDLEWSTDGGTSWNTVSAAVDVGTGQRGGFGVNPDVPVSWRAAIDYAEPTGAYSLTVTYTSTAN